MDLETARNIHEIQKFLLSQVVVNSWPMNRTFPRYVMNHDVMRNRLNKPRCSAPGVSSNNDLNFFFTSKHGFRTK